MTWFGASILYENLIDGSSADGISPLIEERIFVVRADNEGAARKAASAHGIRESLTYANQFGERVDWRFMTVLDVKELFDQAIGDGTEVFYRLLTRNEAEGLVRAVTRSLDNDSEHSAGS